MQVEGPGLQIQFNQRQCVVQIDGDAPCHVRRAQDQTAERKIDAPALHVRL